ncbi:MAG: IS30 family transposase [Kiritimatiellia bacterium]
MAENCTIHHVRGHHLRFDQREAIETVYNANVRQPPGRRKSQNRLAKDLGLAKSTFSREISRGRCVNPTFFAGRTFWEYSAHRAQDSVDEGNRNKGCPMKITNRMAARLQELILKRGHSPNHARTTMVGEGFDMPRSTTTIYNHIEHGDIGIRHGQTPYHPKPRRKRGERPRRSYRNPFGLSIEKRPEAVLRRDRFGHWEMDTVVSARGGRGGLLVLTERKTRYTVIEKIRAISRDEIVAAIRRLVRRNALGRVRSITTDNGGEFSDYKEMCRILRKTDRFLKIYYTHAYAAWEKGSVENANRHIRRFYPKGTKFNHVSRNRVKELQDFINSIPRASLKGQSANESFLLVR